MSISKALGDVHEVQLSQGVIRYRDIGTGTPVVFVHGLVVNGDLWRGVVAKLASDARCITPDWPLGSHDLPLSADADLSFPGLGRMVAEFLDTLDLTGVTLVGSDSGGGIVQQVVAAGDERVARIVLTPCDAFDNFPPRPFGYLKLAAWTPGASVVLGQSMRARWVQRLPIAFGWLTKRPIPAEVMESFVGPVRRDPAIRRDLVRALRAMNRADVERGSASLSNFDGPALVAWCDTDRVFPRKHGRRLAEILPNAEYAEIADSFGFVAEDQPDALADAIRALLSR